MTLTVSQNAVLYLIYFFAYLLALIDRYFVFSLTVLTRRVGKVALVTVNVVFISFVIFSVHTGYTNSLLEVFVPDSTLSRINSGTIGVLGAEVIELPRVVKDIVPPETTARAVLIWDVTNKKELYSLNENEKHAPASTTKLMTALVSLDLYSLEEKLKVPGECTLVDSTRVNYPSGEVFSVKSLLYSLLIASAGDSACVLSSGNIEYDKFVDLMNAKAVEFGMSNTHFTNPLGLDGVNGGHYSTAEDLLLLSLRAIANPVISDIVSTPIYIISSENLDFSKRLLNTNQLLWEVPYTIGVKTGTTEEAGEVLIYQYRDEEKDLIILVMGSEDRFEDTRDLLEWTLTKYAWNREN